ncbi:PAS domain-containing protein [Catenuloplanes indicus]|uniref:PAS domain-containing protein n=1 Tax=Catenuloplanes indicus TaxID=137267 RepID=A0AAE3W3H7_9ACTN|nr:PAS domain-containing protein [Catenuloplanes indicus]MDQ0367675.1 PAS domain-containing protein [Catenuloplanes indicus]
MAHQIELSLSGHQFAPPVTAHPSGMAGWAAVAASATEHCLVIDTDLAIVAASPSCCALLGMGDPLEVVGRPLLDVLRLIDFTANRNALTESDIDKIPPLLAVTSGRLARGLMRVDGAAEPGTDETVDGIATPLFEDKAVSGSLTFFAQIT